MSEELRPQSRKTAMYDLFLLALFQAGGEVASEDGLVASALREAAGIPNSDNIGPTTSHVLLSMEQDGLVVRKMSGKRTYSVRLVKRLDYDEVNRLEAARSANLAVFTGEQPVPDGGGVVDPPHDDHLGQLVKDCSEALEAMRTAGVASEYQTNQGLVGINATGVLRARGMRRERIREILYYLRELGLARGVRQIANSEDRLLWYWEISDISLDPDKLHRLASGERSYQHHRRSNGGTVLEDTRHERTFAGNTPAVLPGHLCGPVTIRKIGDGTGQAEGSFGEGSPEPTLPGDRITTLVTIIETLEEENEILRRQIGETATAHTEEVGKLTAEIERLTNELAIYTASHTRADEVIARYRKG